MHSMAMYLGARALVLKKFEINLNGPEYVHIVARKAGLLAWFFTLCGIDVTTDFRIYHDCIEMQKGSLSGQLHTLIPMRMVSIASSGYMKPVLLIAVSLIGLVLAGIGLIDLCALPEEDVAGAVFMMLIGAVMTVASLIYYFLNKNLMISVVSNSGYAALICFKRSIIEGVSVDYEQAQRVISIVHTLLLAQREQ